MTLPDNTTSTMVSPKCCAISKGFEQEMSDFNHQMNPHAAALETAMNSGERSGFER